MPKTETARETPEQLRERMRDDVTSLWPASDYNNHIQMMAVEQINQLARIADALQTNKHKVEIATRDENEDREREVHPGG